MCYTGKDKSKTAAQYEHCDEILKENVANNVSKPNSQHSEPNCNIMLKNPEDFNTSDGNVKGDDR